MEIDSYGLDTRLFWANFVIPDLPDSNEEIRSDNKIADLQKHHGFDITAYKVANKQQLLRNCVSPEIGLAVLNAALT